jgi:hypothetical protein
MKINLPDAGGHVVAYEMTGRPVAPVRASRLDRIAYSAAHVVSDPLADIDPWLGCAIDWDKTLAYREYLWSLGLGVAEGMDTAQRGMGLSWPLARELIERSVAASRSVPGALIACGAGTDQLAPGPDVTIDDVLRAYEEQIEAVERAGARVILMASRALAKAARGPDDYAKVYGRILQGTRQPVILHWLGESFDPALAGYWGAADDLAAMRIALDIIAANAAKIDGIKISLLSKDKEIDMRRQLPGAVLMYTGDDFNYPELIAGDEIGYSHALLGIFDPIAPLAASALARLTAGDKAGYFSVLAPTLPLSRHIFKSPTMFFKTGVVFLAYLNAHQDHFSMVGGQESARSLPHLVALFKLADQAHAFRDPDLAVKRMKLFLALHGVQ